MISCASYGSGRGEHHRLVQRERPHLVQPGQQAARLVLEQAGRQAPAIGHRYASGTQEDDAAAAADPAPGLARTAAADGRPWASPSPRRLE